MAFSVAGCKTDEVHYLCRSDFPTQCLQVAAADWYFAFVSYVFVFIQAEFFKQLRSVFVSLLSRKGVKVFFYDFQIVFLLLKELSSPLHLSKDTKVENISNLTIFFIFLLNF